MTTRKEAIASGLKFYSTGHPCIRGHVAARALNGGCVECRKEIAKKWYRSHPEHYKSNKAEIISKARIWHENNPVKFKSILQKYRNANAEKIRQYGAKYRAENADRMDAWRAAWNNANQEAIRAKVRNRRARKRNAPGYHTALDTIYIREVQNDRCAHCRCCLDGKGHLDHIMPLSKGGSNWPINLQWLCQFCNDSKGGKDPREFVRETGLMFMCWAP